MTDFQNDSYLNKNSHRIGSFLINCVSITLFYTSKAIPRPLVNKHKIYKTPILLNYLKGS